MKKEEKNESIEKKNFLPIILYVVALIVTIFIGGIVGTTNTMNEIENTYGKEAFEKITPESLTDNKEYNAIYMEKCTEATTVVQTIVFSVLVIVLIALNYKKIKNDMRKWDKKKFIFTTIAAIVLIALNFIISTIFVNLNVEMTNQDSLNSMMGKMLIPTLIYLVVLAPIAEEMIFRYSLGTLIKNKYAFMAVSSILFGLLHGVGMVTIVYIILGLGFSIIYVKTNKNITSSIFVHMLNNIVSGITMII